MLVESFYGKARVRIMRVQREGAGHQVRELSVQVMLQGGFDRAYTHADNRAVIATDTIKNIVNIVARQNVAAATEPLCERLAQFFLDHYEQVSHVVIDTSETCWAPLLIENIAHPHAFLLDANGQPTTHLECGRTDRRMQSGIKGFTFMKSTGSGWTDYVIDEFTTLPETQDRIAATSMNATWLWTAPPADPVTVNARILATMLAVFATTHSHGIQDSVYRMGEAALEAVPDITEIAITCPNKHYVPIDLSPFGMAGDNLVFTPTDEPHGQIECRLRR